jgi:hypothetical protein
MLPCGQASFIATSVVEQESPELPLRQTKIFANRLAGLLGDSAIAAADGHAATFMSLTFSRRRPNSGGGVRHIVRYVFKKGSQNELSH